MQLFNCISFKAKIKLNKSVQKLGYLTPDTKLSSDEIVNTRIRKLDELYKLLSDKDGELHSVIPDDTPDDTSDKSLKAAIILDK